MPVVVRSSRLTDERRQRPILAWGGLLALMLAAGIAVGFPYVAPVRPPLYMEFGKHRLCVHAGTLGRMESWRFALGFDYGGDPQVVRIGRRAWLFYFY